jgi:uncharacterized protein YndB with AHSA1/START domain
MTEAVRTEPIVKEIEIAASPETVFGFFTEPDKITRWLCVEATLDPRPGGVCNQTHVTPEGEGPYLMRGEFVEVVPPSRVVFTWGFENPDVEVAPGASTVEVDLAPTAAGTRVTLTHRDVPDSERESHDGGWAGQLERLAIAATGGDPDGDAQPA